MPTLRHNSVRRFLKAASRPDLLFCADVPQLSETHLHQGRFDVHHHFEQFGILGHRPQEIRIGGIDVDGMTPSVLEAIHDDAELGVQYIREVLRNVPVSCQPAFILFKKCQLFRQMLFHVVETGIQKSLKHLVQVDQVRPEIVVIHASDDFLQLRLEDFEPVQTQDGIETARKEKVVDDRNFDSAGLVQLFVLARTENF